MPFTDSQAAGPGPEIFGVHEDAWTRQQHADGRIFFFNRATGASQWHVPNDLYQPKMSIPGVTQKPAGHDDSLVMPGIANAVLRVDCVAELPESMVRRAEVDDTMDWKDDPSTIKLSDMNKGATTEPTLRIAILGAQGLQGMDTTGKDSNPYCTVEIIGKPHTRIQTHVVKGNLTPQWNFQGVMRHYEIGDVLIFSVWDKDVQGQDMDDLLGKTLLSDDDFDTDEPMEVRLNDAGEGVKAYLTVHVFSR